MLSNMGASVQGERPAHRHVVLHRDLGRKGGLGKSKHLMISVWFVNIWVQHYLNLYIILFIISAVFLSFPPPHQDLVWARKLRNISQT